MLNQSNFTLINQQNGNPAFKLFSFEGNEFFDHLQRNNFFTLIWVTEGAGTVNANFEGYDFEANSLFTFAPYQPYVFTTTKPIKGIAIYFHFDFFCIHKHQKELELNGVLYNNVYQPPFIKVDENAAATFKMLCEQIEAEMQHAALAQHELLVSYLKIFLITASRLKIEQQPKVAEMVKDSKEPFILQKLKDAIEENFKTKHTASEYAELLYISPKALAKITKTHFNKTLSSLINERIIIEAKRELYLTDKTVKQIAYELGYEDEFYFSRFFKVNADVSPQLYRDTVGFARGLA
ncbi:helix-turn-helix domain-containing protein [Ferruginibacter paludis]|uniref:helix-turn-helix domain-containing protein n=1 Tax=Ferruginibacter paludis TaxID=1310417 RepID=UPI0025B2D014|nr:helix-turn-helix domain-containing protein [Ferruginibacter paludis]MDN3653984.1 helix-turn-helix domain-containing protein [Ferruginibacter paludis]